MAKGYSLSVGINKYGPNFPNATELFGCENDARAMHDLAVSQKFERCKLLRGPGATLDNVFTEILDAADKLESGDIFLLTFAGHGDVQDDRDQDEPEDQTIILYDFEAVDDSLRLGVWPRFDPGVRVLMVADSCHSGTVFELPLGSLTSVAESEHVSHGGLEVTVTTEISVIETHWRRVRTISEATRRQHFAEHAAFYDKLLSELPSPAPSIDASVLLLAACQDDENAADGPCHGVFTKALLEIWNGGQFAGNYSEFKTAITAEISSDKQHPVLTSTGQPNPAFIGQRPFTI